MKQSFIVLGHGLTDLYEFKTLIEYNHQRIERLVFSTLQNLKKNVRQWP